MLQDERIISIETPLGPDVLLFRRMTGSERLGQLFAYEVECLAKTEIDPSGLLGQRVTISLALVDESVRYFNGLVARIAHGGTRGEFNVYHLTLRPWLWMLTRSADCRIFQEKTVPDIIKEVFRDHGFSDFEESLRSRYEKWDFCVQYRETAFNFVSRLMEQEGIYYYFKHTNGQHSVVLVDAVSAHEATDGYETIPYFPPDNNKRRSSEHVYQWSLSHEIQPGIYALNDFDFENPKQGALLAKANLARNHQHADLEIYDYPGEYTKSPAGERIAMIRIEELQAQYEQVGGRGNARGLAVGSLFTLADNPKLDQNREYLVTGASFRLEGNDYESGGVPADDPWTVDFSVLPTSTAFRPLRVTPKPVVQGPQTAIVVGKSGEEIWPDKYGRVKVQFHWDRYGKANENSSCWVRVAQVWAGKGWGAMHIPRMGQEVIIEFLEGDPDHPIITGRVYNGYNPPPYDLPANKTQSGVKTRSTKGGAESDFNEIRFEDKKGEEQLYLHAQKNYDIEVENDETHHVGHDRTKTVDHDEVVSVGNNRSESVKKDETIAIGDNRTETVGKDESITIDGNRTEKVGKDEAVSVAGARSVAVAKSESLKVGEARTQDIAKDDALKVGKRLVVDAGDEIVLKSGSGSIVIKKNGDITIKGNNIVVQGSGTIDVKASSAMTLKGSQIKQN